MWKKLGNIFNTPGNHPLALTHAANPTSEVLSDTLLRVYYSSRAFDQRSSIFSVDINIDGEKIEVNKDTITLHLQPGDIGLFDDTGVSMGWLLKFDQVKYLYYLGWNLGKNVPWRNSIGLAISENGSPFKKYSKAPVLDRNNLNPYSISYPCVIKENNLFRMWHGSNQSWGATQEEMNHCLTYAESSDGKNWESKDIISVGFHHESEYAMSKPSVIFEDNIYKMWYSFRGKSYRIGYAESENGKIFTRKDDLAGIDISNEGWDSKTIEYPNIFKLNNRKYLLYNGNNYGLTGFGLAIWQE